MMKPFALIVALALTSTVALADTAAAPQPPLSQVPFATYPDFSAEAQQKAFEAQKQAAEAQQKAMLEQSEKMRIQQQAMVDAQQEYQKSVMEAQRKLNDAQTVAMDKMFGIQR